MGDIVLVLDDYCVIESQPIDEALTFFVDHLPQRVRLVIASREDPQLPLARLRARGQLTELRAADLRFTPVEAADFLNRVMGLSLSAEDIAALENRTEGWIAGLQLAAISMQGHHDTVGFIQSFTGSHRFVLDYLVEEVLQRQPARVRSFLLETSILDRLSGPLCNAMTDQTDAKAMLESLERGNLFVIPLDDQRQWWRYHHLFAEVLQAHFAGSGDRVSEFIGGRRVVRQNDLPAGQSAMRWLPRISGGAMLERVNWRWTLLPIRWLGWVKALPDDLIRVRPVVSVGYAWALLNGGELEASEARLRDAERWLEPADKQSENSSAKTYPERSRRMVVVDEVEFRSLPASIASARAYRALALGDIPGTKVYARQTLALVPKDDLIRRTQATALLGLAEYASGDLPAAERAMLDFQR
jgi:LuxR family maltose regulon positive regulatory protein